MIVAIRNLRAGSAKKPLASAAIRRLLGDRVALLETASLDELQRAADGFADRVEHLIVIGGDGSVSAALGALSRAAGEGAFPRLSIVPGGTMNVIARASGPGSGVERTLARIRQALDGQRRFSEREHTTIRVDDRVGLLFGIGLFANFLAAYNRSDRGTLSALRLLGRAGNEAVFGGALAEELFAPFSARLTVGGAPWLEAALTNVSAGGIEELGFGFRPYTRACERPGWFHLIAHALTPAAALRQLPRIRMGLPMKDVTQDIMQSAIIETDRPMVHAIDGDTFEPRSRFELSAGPRVRIASVS